jgi:hypothetical protein
MAIFPWAGFPDLPITAPANDKKLTWEDLQEICDMADKYFIMEHKFTADPNWTPFIYSDVDVSGFIKKSPEQMAEETEGTTFAYNWEDIEGYNGKS